MNKRGAGFSLLEVIVAFAILALTLGALYQVLSSAARQAVLVQRYTAAVALAESRIAEAGSGRSLARSNETGVSGRHFHWRRTIQPYSTEDELAQAESALVRFRIVVEVRWEDDGTPRSVVLSTVRLRRST